MRRTCKTVAWVLLIALPMYLDGGMFSITAAEVPSGARDNGEILKQLDAVATTSMGQYEKLSASQALSAVELVDWSVAEYIKGHHEESLQLANLARGSTQDSKQRAAIYGLIAQNLGAMGKYEEAGIAATDGQRLDPESKELAACRVVYFTKSGNVLQKLDADASLMRLDDTYASKPVCEPITLTVIAVVAVVSIICGTTAYIVKKVIDKGCKEDPRACDAAVEVVKSFCNPLTTFFSSHPPMLSAVKKAML